MYNKSPMPEPALALLTSALRDAFFDFAAEYRAAGEDRYDAVVKQYRGDFDSYLRLLDEQSRGVNLPPEHVPQSTYWLVDGHRRILASSRLRHGLHPRLHEWGCNIGYDVRPSERRKGYGTLLLSLMLERARRIGLPSVKLTCDATNVGSIRVIQNNGGQLESEYFLERIGVNVKRWIIEL
jgi:predicted acetyltransferase